MPPRLFYGWFVVAAGLCCAGMAHTLERVYVAYGLGMGLGVGCSYVVLGALAAVIGVGMAALIEEDTRDRGLEPDGDALQTGATPSAVSGFAVHAAVKSRRFIGLYAACLACSFGLFVPFVHLIPFALDHGVAQSSAVLLLGAIGGILYTSVALGTLIGPSAAGFAFDLSHSYTLPILIGAGGNIIAAGIMAMVANSAASVRG